MRREARRAELRGGAQLPTGNAQGVGRPESGAQRPTRAAPGTPHELAHLGPKTARGWVVILFADFSEGLLLEQVFQLWSCPSNGDTAACDGAKGSSSLAPPLVHHSETLPLPAGRP